jgi:hypothetical protein
MITDATAFVRLYHLVSKIHMGRAFMINRFLVITALVFGALMVVGHV